MLLHRDDASQGHTGLAMSRQINVPVLCYESDTE